MYLRKEKEFEETMDHLQNDIDSLESERGALRDKLKGYGSKRGDLKASTAFGETSPNLRIFINGTFLLFLV